LSVAVLVDGTYTQAGNNEAFVPRSKEQLESLSAIVKNAVGFDLERGDSVRVEGAQFARLDQPSGDEAPLPLYQKYWQYVAAGAAAVVLLLAALVLVWRKKRTTARVVDEQPARALAAAAAPAGLIEGADPALLAEEEREADALQEEFRVEALSIASGDPATAAIVLRKWLSAPAAAP
jgi:flagellar M-ring protein FliF